MNLRQIFSSSVFALWMSGVASLQLNVTAISARDGSSTLECWQVDQPFNISTEPGTSGAAVAMLSSVANLSYSILPSNFDGGLHNAPRKQWVAFTSGLAYITLPDDSTGTGAYVSGGAFGLIFAADTADVSERGHRTQYLSNTETTSLSIPTSGGEVPEHSVLHMGPCSINEINGIREFALADTGLDAARLR
ncbi:hypothetical protein F4677DRAFT_390915 [Hypoxylon crocopeplum]|nr:hypothetical protein F4677DRAFT_390915 [Hypoxylon crocopeplum]